MTPTPTAGPTPGDGSGPIPRMTPPAVGTVAGRQHRAARRGSGGGALEASVGAVGSTLVL
jgi:hypothetical protein